jgi:hypothetical protein
MFKFPLLYAPPNPPLLTFRSFYLYAPRPITLQAAYYHTTAGKYEYETLQTVLDSRYRISAH